MSKLANQSAVAGAPGILETGGRTLLVSKPSGRDLILMTKWVNAQPLPGDEQRLTSADLAGLDPADRALLIREYAQAKRGRRAPTTAEAVEIVFSRDGTVMQLWLACRKHQPGVRKDEIEALVTEENYSDVAEALDAALEAKEDTTDPKGPGGPPSSGAS